MTGAFKYSALTYITGNVFETDENPRTFIDCKTTQNNFYTKLAEKGITPNTVNTITTEQTSNYLIYGTYLDDGDQYGYIVVLDQNGNILKIITTYDTGTKLSPIITLNYDENGIYGLDLTNGKYRIILLNNVALETPRGYFCKLRTSFYINFDYQPTLSSHGTCPIKKVPGTSKYLIFGTSLNKTTIIEFINNVGMENEWYQYFGQNVSSYLVNACDFLTETTGDTTSAYIYYVLNNDYTKLHYAIFNGTSLGSYQEIQWGTHISDLAMNGKTSIYLATRSSGYITVWKYTPDESTMIIDVSTTGSLVTPSLKLINDILFMKVESRDSTKKYVSCGTYDKNGLNYSTVYEGDASDFLTTNCVVLKTFSLYKFMVQGQNTVMQPTTVIYDNMYSGLQHQSYGSVSSQKGELYSGGYIVFARPLYNKQVFGNQTTSTLEIPNAYLNDLSIDQKDILSKTNNVIQTENTSVSKNIYETLFLNFTNTYGVIDEDTLEAYPQTANYINQNLSIGTEENYNTSFIGKLRINYENYSVMQNITWEMIDYTHYQTQTAIDTTEVPFSIDFMSNDETTVYLTKELDLEQNKTYLMTQKIRIE